MRVERTRKSPAINISTDQLRAINFKDNRIVSYQNSGHRLTASKSTSL